MAAMSPTHHLLRRQGVWCYRRRVPKNIVSIIGKAVLQFSLGTADLKEAKKLRSVEDLKWTARFETAEKQLNGHAAPTGTSGQAGGPLSEEEAIALVRRYVEETDRTASRSLRENPPANKAELRLIAEDADYELGILRNPDDPRADELVTEATRRVLGGADGPTGVGSLSYTHLAEIVRRGLQELSQRKLAHLSDDHGRAFFDQLFDPARRPPTPFSTLAQQFLQNSEEEAAANQHSAKWTDKLKAIVGTLQEIVGAATPVQDVDYDACRRIRSILARLPANRAKLFKGLSIEEAITNAEASGARRLSPTTQEVYLTALRGILDLAAKKRLIGVNPADGLKPMVRDTVAASEKRRPFTIDQLREIFRSVFYVKCSHSSPPYAADKAGWRFWMPIACLFTGMRPNEFAQMLCSDLKKTKAGTWYLDIVATNDEDDAQTAGSTKTVKTAGSRRKIPLHPELLAIGFVDFVEQRKAGKSDARLFPTLKPDKYGNQATYALKRFNEFYLPNATKLEGRQSFYSFRHTWRDALRKIDAQPATLQALGGWSQGTLTSDNYGDKSDPDYQAQFMKLVGFPGLDLSYLHVNQ